MSGVVERLNLVRTRIADACRLAGRSSNEVQLVAVSKRQPDALLSAAFEEGGQLDFGENYVQELLRKQALLPSARFHMVGHVQSNKAKKLGGVHLVHTVDSTKVGRALAKGVEEGARLGVLIEVNLAREPQKAGVTPDQLDSLLEELRALPELEVRGLMCIPPAEEEARPRFAELRRLAESARARSGLELPELSMGMSSDFEEAILEGATLVRVGTAVFGPRAAP